MSFHEVLVAFGANLGDGAAAFCEASRRIVREFGTVQASRLIRTKAVTTRGFQTESEPDYWNAVFRFRVPSTLSPADLLKWLLAQETALGRQRSEAEGEHWAARTADLDLLLWDSLFLDAVPQLVLPHPMMPWRRFVLEPACEIASEWIHPVTGLSLETLLSRLEESRATNAVERFLVWESMEPLPETLLAEARQTHRPILARRWVCRNGEPESVWKAVLALVESGVPDTKTVGAVVRGSNGEQGN